MSLTRFEAPIALSFEEGTTEIDFYSRLKGWNVSLSYRNSEGLLDLVDVQFVDVRFGDDTSFPEYVFSHLDDNGNPTGDPFILAAEDIAGIHVI